jgi:hypothetical protein
MSRLAPALAVALLALPACAAQRAAPLPEAPAVAGRSATQDARSLHVEPREIVYTRRRRKGVVQPVRVWQQRYHGEYTASNRCAGITVTLGRYTERDGSIWNVAARHAQVQSCVVVFTGSGGPRGTNYLHIKILR